MIVNNNMEHYKAEIQLVLKDMKNDGTRNYLGRVKEDELFLIDYIKPFDLFRFI